jgi:hypothetical protein
MVGFYEFVPRFTYEVRAQWVLGNNGFGKLLQIASFMNDSGEML